ncbi:MAG: archaellin/type IV pilin N-terminal domain-containing protein [Nanoarchaeota archaeon]
MIIKNKKGLSEVVTVVLFLALAVVMVGVVWAVVNGLVKDKLSQAGSCFDTSGKIMINNRYTCYNSTSKELQLSLSLGDIDVEEILVGISGSGTSISFKLNNGNSQISNLVSYPSRNVNVTLPKKNAGLTYLFNMTGAGFSGSPDSIRIAPIIGTEQCEAADSIEEVDDCQALA